jgi:hypothetical protein
VCWFSRSLAKTFFVAERPWTAGGSCGPPPAARTTNRGRAAFTGHRASEKGQAAVERPRRGGERRRRPAQDSAEWQLPHPPEPAVAMQPAGRQPQGAVGPMSPRGRQCPPADLVQRGRPRTARAGCGAALCRTCAEPGAEGGRGRRASTQGANTRGLAAAELIIRPPLQRAGRSASASAKAREEPWTAKTMVG